MRLWNRCKKNKKPSCAICLSHFALLCCCQLQFANKTCHLVMSYVRTLRNRCKVLNILKLKTDILKVGPKMRVTLLGIHRYPSTFSRSGHSVRSKTLRAELVSFTIHKSLFPTGRQPGWSRSHVIGFILLPHTLAKCSGCPPRLALGSKEARR